MWEISSRKRHGTTQVSIGMKEMVLGVETKREVHVLVDETMSQENIKALFVKKIQALDSKVVDQTELVKKYSFEITDIDLLEA